MPCLHPSNRRFAAACLAGSLLAAAGGLAFAQAPATGGEGDLVGRAQAWLSGRHQVSASAVAVQPLDARVQSRGCASGWQFDQPIASNDTMLRARCPDNNWQVYLRVTLPPRPAAQAGAGATADTGPGTPSTYNAPSARVQAPAQPPSPPLVKRGQIVLTTWTTVPGLVVSVRMEALDDGRMGDTVRLRNRESGRIVSATVNGQNSAQGL